MRMYMSISLLMIIDSSGEAVLCNFLQMQEFWLQYLNLMYVFLIIVDAIAKVWVGNLYEKAEPLNTRK